MQKSEVINQKLVYWLIFLAILVNSVGLLYPVLRNDDPALYATIAKHMALRNDWINLISNNYDWLDKPHFPFWMSAISFKIFGINSFAYMLPGFLFSLLGAYYTYKLANFLYNHIIGIIATLIYLTSLHLMISSIDVRAEAYLLGEIIPAAYYWLLYDKQNKIKYLLLGALFSALAVMTKGIFVLITIISGMIGMWLYLGEWRKLYSINWLFAFFVTLLFTLPELISLYIQFDMHPDKSLFGHTGVSGIKFFFWDSQFGRFFNSGPITNTHGDVFFFIHTFMWSFLPWSSVFIGALVMSYKIIRGKLSILNSVNEKYKLIYLLSAFFPTFILFSLTKFQLDHYTNILMPFAAILSASFLFEILHKNILMYKLQICLAYLLVLLVIVLSFFVYQTGITMVIVNLIAILCLVVFYKLHNSKYTNLSKLLSYSSLAICVVFMFISVVNGKINIKYDAGYQIAQYLNKQTPIPIIDYKVYSLTLEFHAKDKYRRIDDIMKLLQYPKPYYLVLKRSDMQILKPLAVGNIVYTTSGTTIDKVMANLLNLNSLNKNLTEYVVVLVP